MTCLPVVAARCCSFRRSYLVRRADVDGNGARMGGRVGVVLSFSFSDADGISESGLGRKALRWEQVYRVP